MSRDSQTRTAGGSRRAAAAFGPARSESDSDGDSDGDPDAESGERRWAAPASHGAESSWGCSGPDKAGPAGGEAGP